MLGSEVLLFNGERATQQSLRLSRPVRIPQDRAQVSEVFCNVWMLRPETSLVDLESSPHQGLCLFHSVGVLQNVGEHFQSNRVPRMLRSIPLPHLFAVLLGQRDCICLPASLAQLSDPPTPLFMLANLTGCRRSAAGQEHQRQKQYAHYRSNHA